MANDKGNAGNRVSDGDIGNPFGGHLTSEAIVQLGPSSLVVSIREWLSWSNHQLALLVWSAGAYTFVAIATSPRGFSGMIHSVQGTLLLMSIACSGPVGWGLLKRALLARWVLVGLLSCQTALWISRLLVLPSFRTAGLTLVGCWMTFELIRWDITGRIESGQRYLERLKYVKQKSKPKSLWSIFRSFVTGDTDRLATSVDDHSTPSIASTPELIVDRFCGREIYPIQLAEWHLYDARDDKPPMFHLRIEAGRGTTLHEDTEKLQQEPFWTVNIVEQGMTTSSLVPGARFLVPNGYDESRRDHVTNFYYGTHEVSNQNSVEILKADEDRFLIRIEGEIKDVNFYNSNLPARISVQTWFVEGS